MRYAGALNRGRKDARRAEGRAVMKAIVCDRYGDPEAFRLDELVRRVLEATHDRRRVTTDVLNGRSLIPGDDARIASTRFEDWISQCS